MEDLLKEALIKRAFGEGNINLFSRPVVKNPDGSSSTLHSRGMADDSGNEWLIPGVDEHGARPLLSDDEAWKQFQQTGHYLGKFATPEAGSTYGNKIHEDAEQGYYDVPLASSRKNINLNQLQKVLDFYLKGQR